MNDDFVAFDDFLKDKGISQKPPRIETDEVCDEVSERKLSHKSHKHGGNSHSHGHADSCECGHEHTENSKLYIYMLIGSVVFFIIGLILKKSVLSPAVSAVFLSVSALLAGLPVFKNGIQNAIKGDIDENVLMTIAVAAAMLLGEFTEAAAVAIFFRIGEMLEEFASDRSRESIRSLSEIQAETANILLDNGKVETVDAASVAAGTRIVVYPHERVPLDCVVIKGTSTVDASAITGESLPVSVLKDSEILSGCVNGSDTIVGVTVNTLKNSAASRIIQMVEEASAKKSKTQKAITKIASVYTPIVMVIATLVALIPSLVTHDWVTWTHRALVILVIACPCALVLSVPLGFFTSLGTAARRGILIKGSRYIEDMAKASCVAFDKTGTLTSSNLSIESVTSPVGLDPDAVLLLAAAAELRSTHPIAMTIKAAANQVPDNLVSNIREIPGYGSSAVFCGKTILCGSKKMFEDRHIDTGSGDGIFVALNNRLVGEISIKSEVRSEAGEMIKTLRNSGVKKVVMLTGDSYEAAKTAAQELDVDDFYSDMLPGDKLDKVEELKRQHGKVIYVGDGINDAPVLAAADVGVGMGLGSPAAIENADVVLTNSSISKLAEARSLSEKTMDIFRGNVFFILAVKIIVMILGIAGIAPMWLAVFSDVGVCLISVIISSLIATDDIKSAVASLFKKKA